MNKIEKYYNKFNEDKRLLTRHGQVEFFVTMHYIEKYIDSRQNLNILDIGAGTGRYSVALSEMGHNVTAVELVKHNLNVIKEKSDKITAIQGNALNLKKVKDNSFDITLLLGPMYHLFSFEEKVQALNEAKRVTKKGGLIFVAYVMNDYAVITYAFKEGNIKRCIEEGRLDKNFHCVSLEDDLYSYLTINDINKINKECNITRKQIIGVDGATDYIRPVLNKMDKEDFEIYKKYQLSVCERMDLIGASSHTLDVLEVID